MEFKNTARPISRPARALRLRHAIYRWQGRGLRNIPVTVPIGYSLSGDGLSIGRDTLSAVSLDYMGSTFPLREA